MLTRTANDNVMTLLSDDGWKDKDDELEDKHEEYKWTKDKKAKARIDELGTDILNSDYSSLESFPLRMDKFIHLGDNVSNIQFAELKAIAKFA